MAKRYKLYESEYTHEIGAIICDEISSTSKSLQDIVDELNEKYEYFPCRQTILRWRYKCEKDKKHPEMPSFDVMYHQAKMSQVESLLDECKKIADDGTNDYLLQDNGVLVVNKEHISRSKIRIEHRRWTAAKLMPRIYGESKSVQLEATTVKQEDIIKLMEEG